MSHHLITGGADERPYWTPVRWNDGYLDNKGRFRVYRPDHPGAYKGGYALRYHVLYWLTTGEPVPEGFNLHHRNGVRDDDRFENLELLRHGEHARLHNPRTPRLLICEHCGREFSVNHEKGRCRQRFCTQVCYHAHPRSAEHLTKQAAGIKRAYAEGRR